jgi:hypothetical protein
MTPISLTINKSSSNVIVGSGIGSSYIFSVVPTITSLIQGNKKSILPSLVSEIINPYFLETNL